MARLSKIHQRVLDRTALKQRRVGSAETSPSMTPNVSYREVPAITADQLMHDDAELKKIMDELDARGEPPPNTFWDDANRSYTEIREVLDATNEALAEELHTFVTTDNERKTKMTSHEAGRLTVLVNQVGQDVGRYYGELDEIHELHKDKAGGVRNGDEAMAMLEVQNAYQGKAVLFNKLVTPLVDEINQLIGVSERAAIAMAEAAARAPLDEVALGEAIQAEEAKLAQDPTVITDVVVKAN